jgi:branched-chain amino acid transport system permease protein
MLTDLVAGGLASGALYGLLALAIVLIFRVSGVANFAQGEVAMISAFATYQFITLKMPLWLAVVGGLAFSAIFGITLFFLIIIPMRGAPPLRATIATLGAQIALSATAVKLWAANQPYRFPSFVPLDGVTIHGINISQPHLLILTVTVVLVVALWIFFHHTKAGLAMRTVSQSQTVARLCGIPVERVLAQTWALSCMTSAMAGILFAPIVFLSTSMMDPFQLRAFTAAILGGMQSWPGVVIGGLIFGVMENLVSAYLSSQLQPAIAYLTIVLVLLFRPAGLFGRRHLARV